MFVYELSGSGFESSCGHLEELVLTLPFVIAWILSFSVLVVNFDAQSSVGSSCCNDAFSFSREIPIPTSRFYAKCFWMNWSSYCND